jgi:hypothetical protein
LAAIAASISAAPGNAQTYPAKPVRIIVPFIEYCISIVLREAKGKWAVFDERP